MTKNNPGKFDCYANAEPDEPMFVLLGRDPAAGLVVTFWNAIRAEMKGISTEDLDEKGNEAADCAQLMESWALIHGKSDELVAAHEAFERVIRRAVRSQFRSQT